MKARPPETPAATRCVAVVSIVMSLASACAGHDTLPDCPAPPPPKEVGPAGAFFRSVRSKVGKTWDPNAALRADPNGERVGGRDRYTILTVTVRAGGELADVQVTRGSGLQVLDTAAVDALHRAAPFDPPPAQLLGKDGTVRFPFGLYLEASSRPPRCRPASDVDRRASATTPLEPVTGSGRGQSAPRSTAT